MSERYSLGVRDACKVTLKIYWVPGKLIWQGHVAGDVKGALEIFLCRGVDSKSSAFKQRSAPLLGQYVHAGLPALWRRFQRLTVAGPKGRPPSKVENLRRSPGSPAWTFCPSGGADLRLYADDVESTPLH